MYRLAERRFMKNKLISCSINFQNCTELTHKISVLLRSLDLPFRNEATCKRQLYVWHCYTQTVLHQRKQRLKLQCLRECISANDTTATNRTTASVVTMTMTSAKLFYTPDTSVWEVQLAGKGTQLSKICVLALQNRVYGTEIKTWSGWV
jgi:hypothetical protein